MATKRAAQPMTVQQHIYGDEAIAVPAALPTDHKFKLEEPSPRHPERGFYCNRCGQQQNKASRLCGAK